jgi:O-antigen/teichoic acid export membrane protein
MYCRRHFKECRFEIKFQKSVLKEISAFSVWNFIGCSASILKDQGVNVMFNIFVGPVLNAARGVATSVNGAVSGFAGNFMTALKPQITKSYASGNLEYTHYLVERGSRFSFYILLFLVVPILLETEYILTIWLRQFPEHSVNFVRLVLILSLAEVISNTLMTLQNATGKMRNYQLIVGGLLLLNFPLSYLCLRQGFAPEFTYVVALIIAIVCMIARLMFVRKSAGLSMSAFIKNVVLNISLVAVCAFIPPYICRLILVEGFMRFMIVGGVSVISSIISILFIGCNKSERRFIYNKLSLVFNKI